MGYQPQDMIAAVREAFRYIARSEVVPSDNRLLNSPVVTQRLREAAAEDTPENRQAALVEVMRDVANAYANQAPAGARDRRKHERVFSVLYGILTGQRRDDVPSRSYDRYHAEAVRSTTEEIARREDALRGANHGPHRALMRARDLLDELESEESGYLDVFGADELLEQATIIANQDYYEQARPFFSWAYERLLQCPSNLVYHQRMISALRMLAQCYMNLDELSRAVRSFEVLANAVADDGDWEIWIHSMQMLGVAHRMAGNYSTSLVCFGRAVQNAHRGEAPRDYRSAWIARDEIGAYLAMGEYGRIDSLARYSLQARERLGDGQGALTTYEIWGRALLAQGRYRAAEAMLRNARALLSTTSSELFRTMVHATFGALYVRWGRAELAEEHLATAREIALQHQLWGQIRKIADLERMLKGPRQ